MIFWRFLDSVAPNSLGLDVLCDCACLPSRLGCVATLCNLIDCNPPGSSVRGILQARILEWVAISCSRGSSWPRDWTHISHICLLCGVIGSWQVGSLQLAPPGKPVIDVGLNPFPRVPLRHFFFNWSIIPLQCCVTFYYTVKWISSAYITNSVNSFHPSLSPSPCPHFHSLCLHFYSCLQIGSSVPFF